MSRYELVIFDWDGTIMDSTGLIACVHPGRLPRDGAAGAAGKRGASG